MGRGLNYGVRGAPLTPAEAKALGVKISAAQYAYAIASGLADPPENIPILSITTHPTNQTASNGVAAFSIVAATADGSPISYQWQKQDGGAGDFGDISGETSDTLSLTAQTYLSENGDVFRCVVSAAGETLTSNNATLTVPQPVITITSQPSNQTASSGSATFSVSATVTQNATPITYQWQKQEGGAGAFSNVSGATSSSLALSSLTRPDDHGDVYRCVVGAADGAANVTSSSATLTVYATPNAPTSLSATAGDAELALSWTAPTDNGGQSITGYRVEYTPAGGSASTVDTNSTSTSYTLSSLTNNTAYTVRVAALNSVGAGAYSTSVTEIPTGGGGGGGAAPILLATFNVARVVDSGPNNYWLNGADGYYDIADGGLYGDTDPEVSRSPYVAGKYSTYALVTGDNTPYGGSGGRQLGVGVIDKAGVGAAHLNAQLISSSFTMEAWIKPTVALANKDPNNYYYFVERYLRVGPWTLTGVSAYADNWSNPLYDPETLTGPVCTVLKSESGFIANAHSLTVLTANAWNHVAFVRDVSANELRVYLNGALIITAADDPAWALSSAWPSYGSITFSHYYNERMYYDQCRIMPGAIYSGATITPPAAGFSYTRSTAPAATTELLLNATHGLEDWGARAGQVLSRRVLSPSGFLQPSVSTSVAKWGAASYVFGDENDWSYPARGMQLRGNVQEWMFGQSGDYLSTLMAVLNNGPWTIEAWVRPMASISYSASPESYAFTDGETYMTCSFWDSIITVYDNTISVPGANYYATPVAISAGTTLEFFHSYYDSALNEQVRTSYRVTAPTSLARNQWHHIAVVADVANNLLRLKINGAEVGTIDISQTWSNKGATYGGDFLYFGGTYDFSMGYNYPAYGFKGYMDDIRVSSAALYGTGSYSVPAAPLT